MCGSYLVQTLPRLNCQQGAYTSPELKDDADSQVFASDGGYRRSPIPFPADGLFFGVAERYEVGWPVHKCPKAPESLKSASGHSMLHH
jgi:hypothetical protein